MKCFSLTVGARNTKAGGHSFLAADDAILRKITASYFPEGFSILNINGGWFDPTRNRFTKEEGRQIWICTSKLKSIKRWAQALALALGQKELLLVQLGRAMRLTRKQKV